MEAQFGSLVSTHRDVWVRVDLALLVGRPASPAAAGQPGVKLEWVHNLASLSPPLCRSLAMAQVRIFWLPKTDASLI